MTNQVPQKPILRTKLYTPPMRAELIPRPRLISRLNAGLVEYRKLTLISAPAGYGKTTLVAAWLATLEQHTGNSCKAAWLSLDVGDNDPSRFINYWLAALQLVDQSLGLGIETLLGLSTLPPLAIIMGELLNDLASLNTRVILVLDDYHVLTNPALHEAMAYFIEHQPPMFHLLLTTREDPPLPLARLRARGQLTEIRAHELRFTTEEAQQFFTNSMHLALDVEAINTLETRTEGWAAGLQLAALALQHLPNPEDFLADFGGSHRYVIDYLAEEVIRQQDDFTKHFLTQTAILDRFCAPLCDALLMDVEGQWRDDDNSSSGAVTLASSLSSSAIMLDYLERNNLFLIPLDGERRWYRYHHLFADYLRAGLSADERTDLYKKASVWHETTSMPVEAVQYALASGDYDFSADVIARTFAEETTWSGGNLAQWLSWLDALPRQVYQSRPQLSLDASRILYLSGRFEPAEDLLEQTEESLGSLEVESESERKHMLALVALYRGAISAVYGDFQTAMTRLTFAQQHLERDQHLLHARAYFSLGLAYEIADQTGEAVENYILSSQEAQSARVLFLAINALCAAAQVQIRQGRLELARQSCQTAIGLTEGARLAPLGLAWSILGGICLEQNDLVSAEELLLEGTALSRQGGLIDDEILGLAYLARLRYYLGDPDEALKRMQEAKSLMQTYDIHRMDLLASAYLARLHLHLGEIQAAEKWAEESQLRNTPYSQEFIQLTLARVLMATRRLDGVSPILQPLLEKANAAGRTQTSIEVMLLLALCSNAQNDKSAALIWLEKSLRLAAPAGFVRVFLDERESLQELLIQVRSVAPEFVDLLLQHDLPVEKAGLTLSQQLLDPLTAQELRVLALLADGLSNQEIADELVVSVGTAKWHVHNVLQKLDVPNRTQAALRAQELGLV